jgi:hypothetical protein
LYQLPHWIWPAALMTVCVLAAWRGRDDERLAAGGLLANWALSMVVFKAQSEDTQWAVSLLDVALAGLYVWIALRSRRYWPLFAAGIELLVIVAHLGHAVDSRVSGWAYLTAQLLFAYLGLIPIAYGAITAPKRYAEIDALDANDAPGATRR